MPSLICHVKALSISIHTSARILIIRHTLQILLFYRLPLPQTQKDFLAGLRFENDEELKAGMTTWLKNLNEMEYKKKTRHYIDKC